MVYFYIVVGFDGGKLSRVWPKFIRWIMIFTRTLVEFVLLSLSERDISQSTFGKVRQADLLGAQGSSPLAP
jgi:hypothetical protein